MGVRGSAGGGGGGGGRAVTGMEGVTPATDVTIMTPRPGSGVMGNRAGIGAVVGGFGYAREGTPEQIASLTRDQQARIFAYGSAQSNAAEIIGSSMQPVNGRILPTFAETNRASSLRGATGFSRLDQARFESAAGVNAARFSESGSLRSSIRFVNSVPTSGSNLRLGIQQLQRMGNAAEDANFHTQAAIFRAGAALRLAGTARKEK